MALKSAGVQLALWTCVALSARTVLYAQARPPAPDPPDVRMLLLPEDQLSDEEESGANPCRRRRDVLAVRDTWRRMTWLAFCVQRSRSRAVSQAWEKGLDEHGVKLEADAHARKLVEMEIWLRRLPGKYLIEGKYWNPGGSSAARGKAECFGIGSGPGVSCLISTEWTAPKEVRKDPNVDTNLHDAMRGVVLLFGIDPGAQQVRVTLVDFRAIGMRGFLDEGTVMFEGRPNFENINPFFNALVTYTWGTSLVTSKPGGDLEMKLFVHTPGTVLFDLQLHRELPAKTS